jgi:hypothetical protein
VNDAQSWTLIAGFFTLTATMIALTLRAVRAEIAVLGAQFDARIGSLDARMDARMDGLERTVQHLDRDVHTVIARLMEG